MDNFRKNLSIVDNLQLYKVDALIAHYIYKIPVVIIKFNYGYQCNCRVMYHSTYYEYLPRYRKTSYIEQSPYPKNWHEFYRPTQHNKRALDLAKKMNCVIYLTFADDKVISTINNKYQLSGSFAEVLSKTCLMYYFETFNIDLTTEDLSFLNEKTQQDVWDCVVEKRSLKVPKLLKRAKK